MQNPANTVSKPVFDKCCLSSLEFHWNLWHTKHKPLHKWQKVRWERGNLKAPLYVPLINTQTNLPQGSTKEDITEVKELVYMAQENNRRQDEKSLYIPVRTWTDLPQWTFHLETLTDLLHYCLQLIIIHVIMLLCYRAMVHLKPKNVMLYWRLCGNEPVSWMVPQDAKQHHTASMPSTSMGHCE